MNPEASDPRPATSTPHLIRLRGPWRYRLLTGSKPTCEGITESASELPTGTVQLPSTWEEMPGVDVFDRVQLTRRFGRPANLGGEDVVYLVVRSGGGAITATLNGATLGELAGEAMEARLDVTRVLRLRNELVLGISRPLATQRLGDPASASGVPIVEVHLEITAALGE